MQKLLMRIIYVARRLFFRTPLAKTRLAAHLYSLAFEAAAPDLTRPVPFRGTTFYVDPADRAVVPSIVGGYFERKELDIFEVLVRHSSVFFDVGANIGLYSILGCLHAQSLRAYAFEPVAENQDLLRRNIDAHRLEDRVTIAPVAVSDATGSSTIHLYHSGTHSLADHRGSDVRLVDTVTLDAFTTSEGVSPDIIKIDVEGHESAVIDGATAMLSRDQPTVFIEYIPAAHGDVEDLVSRLRSVSSTCFVIDEITGRVREIALDDLDRRNGYNLILTANARHAEEIRRFVTAG